MAAIVTSDLANFLTAFLDLSPDVVLPLKHVGTELNRSLQVVLFVVERLLVNNLMAKGA